MPLRIPSYVFSMMTMVMRLATGQGDAGNYVK